MAIVQPFAHRIIFDLSYNLKSAAEFGFGTNLVQRGQQQNPVHNTLDNADSHP